MNVSALDITFQPDDLNNQLPKLIDGWDPPEMPSPSRRVQQAITISMAKGEIQSEIQTDLDSHANMVVVGRHSFIISYSGKFIDVNAFYK